MIRATLASACSRDLLTADLEQPGMMPEPLADVRELPASEERGG
jgi:hypothetical protein